MGDTADFLADYGDPATDEPGIFDGGTALVECDVCGAIYDDPDDGDGCPFCVERDDNS